jgi:hypothetical protein
MVVYNFTNTSSKVPYMELGVSVSVACIYLPESLIINYFGFVISSTSYVTFDLYVANVTNHPYTDWATCPPVFRGIVSTINDHTLAPTYAPVSPPISITGDAILYMHIKNADTSIRLYNLIIGYNIKT